MITSVDRKHMARAIELAYRGAGFVSPNPMVGCVIARRGQILAEGWYKKYGGPHAEVHALKKCKMQNAKCKDATVYVTLEPHSYHGKTPPCTDVLIAAGVKRVVVGMKDPNPKVAGKGIRQLRKAGIEVTVGVLQKECQELNEDFVKWVTTKRPLVLLKVALTLDGALTLKKGTRSDFSSPQSYKLVHDLRQRYDAIGLGVESVIIDNPLLTTRRKQKFRNPVRVIFDTHLRIQRRAQLLHQPGRTIIFTSSTVLPLQGGAPGASRGGGLEVRNVSTSDGPHLFFPISGKETPPLDVARDRHRGGVSGTVEYVKVPLSKDGHVSLRPALKWLGEQGIMSILVEGGAALAQSFLRQGLVDKLMITFTPHVSLDPKAPRLFSSSLPKFSLQSIRWEQRGPDGWMTAYLG